MNAQMGRSSQGSPEKPERRAWDGGGTVSGVAGSSQRRGEPLIDRSLYEPEVMNVGPSEYGRDERFLPSPDSTGSQFRIVLMYAGNRREVTVARRCRQVDLIRHIEQLFVNGRLGYTAGGSRICHKLTAVDSRSNIPFEVTDPSQVALVVVVVMVVVVVVVVMVMVWWCCCCSCCC